jgi:periplasmic protein TonB
MSSKRSPKVLAFPRRARHRRHLRWHAALAALDARVDDLERRLGGRPRTTPTSIGSRMRTAVLASVLAHAFILYAVTVQVPDRSQRAEKSPQLEIVLINAKSKAAPAKADILAQHNLDGGGNTDEKRRAQSPLPVLPDQTPEAEVKLALRRVEKLEHEAKQLMTQKQSNAEVRTAPAAAKAGAQPEGEPVPAPQAVDLVQRSLEIARLEAQIARDWNAYQERPRKRFLGARAQEVRFARYVEDWRQKIERVGDVNYPQGAREQRLQGRLLVTVGIKADGTLDSVDINRPSGHKVLDDGARRIVQLAAPFAAFPADIAKDTDVLYITRWWTFTSSDRFQSE